MEPANYELVRYPSGQVVILTVGSGPRDVVGVFTSEREAQSALARLVAGAAEAKMQSIRAA
jgi:hypothetical protein